MGQARTSRWWVWAAVVGLAAATAPAGQFRAAVGTSYHEDPATGVDEAFAQALGAFGDLKDARLILVSENYPVRAAEQVAPRIFAHAAQVPVYGSSMGSGDYSPLSYEKGFSPQRGIAVLVLGGDFEFQAEMETLGKVTYYKGSDRRDNPEKFERDWQTFIDHRQKPAEAMGGRFRFGPEQNLLIVFGQLHNPEITHFANGLKAVIPAEVPVLGGASQGGAIYFKDRRIPSAVMGLLISGRFHILQGNAGSFWDGKNLPAHFKTILTDAGSAGPNRPDLVLGLLCGSWRKGELADQHKALVETLPAGVPFWGTYSGGEMFVSPKQGLTGTGGCGAVVSITGRQ